MNSHSCHILGLGGDPPGCVMVGKKQLQPRWGSQMQKLVLARWGIGAILDVSACSDGAGEICVQSLPSESSKIATGL